MSKKYILFALLVALTIVIASCQSPANETPVAVETAVETDAQPVEQTEAATETSVQPVVTEPVVFRMGIAQSASTLNPAFAALTIEGHIFRMIYESLFDLDLNGEYINTLTEEWSMSEDGLTATFKIHEGAIWHDGEPLTAEDVAFTFNLYKSREDSSRFGRAKCIDTIEVVDDYNFILHLTSPQANLPDKLRELYILPKHIWEPLGTGDDLTNFANTEAIGSGPFRLEEWRKGEFIHFTANKEHWQYPPQIDEMIWQEFTNNDAKIQALVTGQIDAVNAIPLTAYTAVKNSESVQVVSGIPAAPHIADIILNGIDPANCPADTQATCGGNPALRDRAVRQALAYATNKQELIDVILMGQGVPGKTIIASINEFYNSDLEDYAFDIAKGNAVLDEAGYVDTDGDGIREMPNDPSVPLTFDLNFPADCANCPREAELLMANWEQLGVKIEAQAMEEDALVPFVNPGFQHDIVLWGWTGSPDPNFMLSVCTTEQIVGYNNETGYSNPEYDALYKQQETELDHDARVQMVWDMQKILLDDVAYIIPYYDRAVYAVRTDRFAGWPVDLSLVNALDVRTLTSIVPLP